MSEEEQQKIYDRLHESQIKIVKFLATLGLSEAECVAVLSKKFIEMCMILKMSKPFILSRVSETYEILDSLYEGRNK